MGRRLAIAAIIAISLGGPVIELFDRWDPATLDGNDTEANLVLVALCVGVAFAVGTIAVVTRIRTLSSTAHSRAGVSHSSSIRVTPFSVPSPTSSPPTVLRV